MTCENPDCKKRFKPAKAWAKHCSKKCGDLVRARKYRRRVKRRAAVRSTK